MHSRTSEPTASDQGSGPVTNPPDDLGKSKRPAKYGLAGVRLDAATLERVDALVPLLTPFAANQVRSTALRASILAGLDVLEAKYAPRPTEARPSSG